MSLCLEMANDGFTRMMDPRGVEVVLRNTNTGAKHTIAADEPCGNRLRFLGTGETVTRTGETALPADLSAGDYEVLLSLPDPYPSLHDRPEYSIRLANTGVWEEATGHNRLMHRVTVG